MTSWVEAFEAERACKPAMPERIKYRPARSRIAAQKRAEAILDRAGIRIGREDDES
jgi:hypothetical protein